MKEYDVIIIGSGIAGSSTAYNLRQLNPNLSVAIIDKNSVRPHKSYYVRQDLLEKYNATPLIHNKLFHQTKETDSGFYDRNHFGHNNMGSVNYNEFCSHLSGGANMINSMVTEVTEGRVKLKSGEVLESRVVIDATGHESYLRKKFDLRTPKFGVEVIMYDMKNVLLPEEDWHTIRLGLGNITNWGVWIEPIDKETSRAYIGTGNLRYLEGPIDTELLDEMISRYLNYYSEIFREAEVERRTYTKIAADPVKQVVLKVDDVHFAWIGESAGQIDPYWTIGSGRILELSEVLAKAICDTQNGTESDLLSYQQFWDEELNSFYKKNWARARLFYNLDQNEWSRILENRSKLEDELDSRKMAERQSGKISYGFLHTLKMVGFKNIIRYLRYQRIFKKRLSSRKFWDEYNPDIRKSLL